MLELKQVSARLNQKIENMQKPYSITVDVNIKTAKIKQLIPINVMPRNIFHSIGGETIATKTANKSNVDNPDNKFDKELLK